MECTVLVPTHLSDPHQRERLLSMLLSELNGMVYLGRVDQYWTLEYASQGCYQLTGYRPEQLALNRQMAFVDLIHPEDREQVAREVHAAVAEGRTFTLEYRILHADGSERWVAERGRGINQDGVPQNLIHGFIQDITPRYLREKQLVEAEQRYRSIFENAIEGIFQSTSDGHYLQVNRALARIYGYDSPEAMIEGLRDIGEQLYLQPGRRDEFIRLMRDEGVVTNFESRVYRKDRSVIWISENAHTVTNADGELLYYEGTVEDITERKAYEELIAFQATHDYLTRLPNRALLLERIDQAIHMAGRSGSQVAVMFVDLDHFKNVNDSLGHVAGDELIRVIAERLRHNVRDSDTVARLGGDEFVLLIPEVRRDSGVVTRAVERVLAAIEQPCVIGDQEYLITCSIGVSLYPDDGVDGETLLKNADIAMYRAKQTGRNGFHFFTAELDERTTRRLKLEQQLRVAINEQQFCLYYQPKFATASGQLMGVEALIRWFRPGIDQVIMPSQFIPLAEETGLINALGKWVLDEACRKLSDWIDRGIMPVPVAINLSARQFMNPGLVDMVATALQYHAIAPELLVIEVTETCLAVEEELFLEKLAALRSLGVSIAIDDFGTGYSNMRSLRTMPVDYIKIDRSFLPGVEHNSRDRAIYRAMIAMAGHLGLKVVSEGVENRQQYEFLRDAGCDEVQGFHFARPMPAGDFEQCLLKAASRNTAFPLT